MVYYITPPCGNVGLESLRHGVLSRLNCLMMRYCRRYGDGKEYACFDVNWTIEGTENDRASHFMLQLVCCEDWELRKIFVKMEKHLFISRIQCMSKLLRIKFIERGRNEIGQIIGEDIYVNM